VRSDTPQTSNQAFLALFTAVSQLKNIQIGLSGSQEMRISSVEKWGSPVLNANKNEEQPKGFAGRNYAIERL